MTPDAPSDAVSRAAVLAALDALGGAHCGSMAAEDAIRALPATPAAPSASASEVLVDLERRLMNERASGDTVLWDGILRAQTIVGEMIRELKAAARCQQCGGRGRIERDAGDIRDHFCPSCSPLKERLFAELERIDEARARAAAPPPRVTQADVDACCDIAEQLREVTEDVRSLGATSAADDGAAVATSDNESLISLALAYRGHEEARIHTLAHRLKEAEAARVRAEARAFELGRHSEDKHRLLDSIAAALDAQDRDPLAAALRLKAAIAAERAAHAETRRARDNIHATGKRALEERDAARRDLADEKATAAQALKDRNGALEAEEAMNTKLNEARRELAEVRAVSEARREELEAAKLENDRLVDMMNDEREVRAASPTISADFVEDCARAAHEAAGSMPWDETHPAYRKRVTTEARAVITATLARVEAVARTEEARDAYSDALSDWLSRRDIVHTGSDGIRVGLAAHWAHIRAALGAEVASGSAEDADPCPVDDSASWSVGIGGSQASLAERNGAAVFRVGASELVTGVSVDRAVMLIHSLCHVVMDHHADEHSSCHDRNRSDG